MPAVPDLQNNGSEARLVAPLGRGYSLAWSADSIHRGLVERSCIIVYTDGRYRLERSSQRFQQAMSTRVFEATLSAAQVADLKIILASPDLTTLKHDFDQTRPASDVELARFVIPRETTIQRLTFGSYFNVLGNAREVGGISNLQYWVEQDRNAIKPLQEWLKKNIDGNKALVQTDTRPTNCIPSLHDN